MLGGPDRVFLALVGREQLWGGGLLCVGSGLL